LRKKKNILFEEQGDDALLLLNLGGAGRRPLRGNVFPLKYLKEAS